VNAQQDSAAYRPEAAAAYAIGILTLVMLGCAVMAVLTTCGVVR
jgi:hypothetical protein